VGAGVVTLAPSQWGLVLSVIAVIVGLGMFVRDVVVARQQWSRLQCVAVASPFPVAEVQPPLGYEESVYLSVPSRGTMLVRPDVDRVLQEGPMSVELDPTPYRLPVELRELAPVALRTMRAGRVIFDGPMLGLRDDLSPAVSGHLRPLRLMQTSFFMQVCSAELCQYRIVDRITGVQTDIRLEELVSPSGRLVTLAESRLANNIGISTLAFTSDDQLLVVHQSQRNIASARLLAPSGSGTLEPRDLIAAGADASLQDVLVHGMERELCEETGIRVDDVLETRVVGFGRWLERGAKPEFFAVTRLKILASDVAAAKISAGEKIYTERVGKVFVNMNRLQEELDDGYPIDQAPSCPLVVRDSGSLPLIAGLRAVALNGQARTVQ
jgi:8-oxo-dGTP pyrophosphatase MutT (NUDIX family)